MSIYYISPEETKIFHPKEVQILVSAIKIRINLCFSVSKNVVPVEDILGILEMHNVDYVLTEVARYNARIRCHYISWDLKIRLDNLNEVNNGFTWMKFFTQGCHKMAKAVIIKIIDGKMVQK